MFDGIGLDMPRTETTAQFADRLREAEQLGFDSLWTVDSAAPGTPSALETLAYAAAVTERARLGVAVLLSALHSPLHLAREVATVDRLSDGRLTLAVGVGHGGDSYARHGIAAPRHRGRHFEAGVVTMRRLLTETSVTSDEPPLRDQPRPLDPVQQPAPPLWFGARSGTALERAARLGDGWIGAGSSSLADFYGALDAVRAHLRELDRDPAQFEIAKRVYVHVGPHNPGTIAALERWFESHYRDGGMAERVMLSGPVDEVVAELSAMRERGVGTIVLGPVIDQHEQTQLLARDVIPHLPPRQRSAGALA